nr:chymotrypsin-2-like [Onthophagus taurus]
MKLFVVFAALLACALAGPMVRVDPNLDWRIVGGSNAASGQFPFMVSQRSGSTTSHMCGGTIINNRWILSAAHCLTGSGAITFVAGSHLILTGGVRFAVSRRLIHANYNPTLISNDVGVVQLASAISFGNLIQPIALESGNVGAVAATVVGWGRIQTGGAIPNNLQWLNLNSITVADCQNRHSHPVFANNICSLAPNGQGICQGDSGGPLLRRGTNIQLGIASWVIPCARGWPDVFARVSSFLPWINNAITS